MQNGEEPTTEELADRVFQAALGTIDIFSIHLGDRLGWYRSLADDGPATADELASRTGTHPRYAREWLEQQAVTGLLAADEGDPRRFTLPAAGVEVFTGEQSENYLAPLARMFMAAAAQAPALVEAYRTGGGVGWEHLGPDGRESQADMNRPWFENRLAGALQSTPDADALLRPDGAQIADVGSGAGWSTIALARAYPGARLHGYDVDAASVELARRNAGADPSVAGRIAFSLADAADLPEARFDAVFAFECLHDMPQPVEVLAAARRSLRPGGAVIVMDEAVADEFTAPGDDVERLMYGFSLGVCLPDGMNHRPTAATGTVIRRRVLEGYARQAGFTRTDVLPIEDFGFWRFYLLRG
ncbi:class I SAM-dependent methyltransferase [Zhihengliuella salsuginis]|uniref:SAM-dependent methyltransferase n=1 Tax=Zhihengliuella salsuginis TaxID=578222 RepID=A0ABQ3GKT9_9MICC|nr:class I SAM-dependent methyltransferase [Zhihengliuella salsuginis]GHD13152.1 SAM-dependent methyltransferase [Zhihengliuella salsuginis]